MASSRKSSLAELADGIAVLPAGSSILVGLSGGVDSVVLLHLLHGFSSRFSWNIKALHVHHGISPNADDWALFCSDLCARLGIAFAVKRVDISPFHAHGVEAAARKSRYAAYAEEPCDFVALAHHRDDQAETLILQLLRGAGVKGASAMPLVFDADARQKVVRPLLHCTRDEILAYAHQHSLQWIEDESNADVNYPRNFLRHRVFPLLAQKFPRYRETLSRSAGHFAEAGSLLDDLAELDGVHAMSNGALSISALQKLSHARAKNLLRYFLHVKKAPMPQAVQIEEMLRQILLAREDADVRIEFGGWQVRRFQGEVHALQKYPELDGGIRLPWQGEPQLFWPATGRTISFSQSTGSGVSLEKLQRQPVTLRLRRGGEVLRPAPGSAARSLKNLFQERGIPPWQRERLPLLYCGEDLVSVIGVANAAEYQCGQGERGLVPEMAV